MPTPCEHCHEWLDLNDGYASQKWYPNIIICHRCHELETAEIDLDEEIEELENTIADAEYTLAEASTRLAQLNAKRADK